ncbi:MULTISPECIES: hypothetical protein [unclassified Kitasatospora]|uniref:hypothetical protein n=1 Tax=unclassified Kitasatospora TaxID=2633591 RepID=UPI002F90816F
MDDVTRSWEILPLAVVRPTGFPTDLLAALADPALLDLVDAARADRSALDAVADAFEQASREAPRLEDADQLRAARTAYRAVKRRRAPAEPPLLPAGMPGFRTPEEFARWWSTRCRARDTHLAALDARYPQTLDRARRHIDTALRSPRLREALVLLTPEILGTTVAALLKRPPTGPAPNQNERKAAAFLQRLAAKCETNAFAGPIAYAEVGQALPWADTAPVRRGHLAFWAVQAVLDRALDRLAPGDLGWRTGPAAGLLPADSPVLRAVRQAAAGRAGAIAPATLRTLHRKNLLWATRLLAPTSEPDALRLLRTAATDLDDTDLTALAALLTTTAAEFADADADGKTAAVARTTALLTDHGVDTERRGKGQLYADRVVLYEEDHDPGFRVRFTEAGAARLFGRLDPVLDLAAAAGVEAWQLARERFTHAWRQQFGPTAATASLPEVLRTIPVSTPAPLAQTGVGRRFQGLVQAAWDGASTEVVLDPADVRAILPDLDDVRAPLLIAPDLHFDSTDRAEVESGRAPVVVGEFHWGFQGLGNLCCFIDDRGALARTTRQWLGHDTHPEELVHVATGARFGKLCYLELLPRTLELSGPAAPGQGRLQAEDIDVHPDGDMVQRSTGQSLMPLLGDAEAATQSPLGPPGCALPRVSLGALTPRITIGDVVVQRAAWQLEPGALQPPDGARPAGRYRHTVDTLRALGVPRRLFAAVQGERKPVHVDLASPHLVELLLAEAKDRPVRVTEMLPTPEGTWQRSEHGRHLCEIRFSARRRRRTDQTTDEPGTVER